jgi:hypothetical protein
VFDLRQYDDGVKGGTMLGVKNGIMTALSPTLPVFAAQHFERVITENRISDADGHRKQGMRHFRAVLHAGGCEMYRQIAPRNAPIWGIKNPED